MRRLWANILIAFGFIVATFASLPSTIGKVTTNGDFKTQRQFTFQLSQIEKNDGEQGDPLEEDSAAKMAKIMESRLIQSKISAYTITTSGNDIIDVTFAADNDTAYQQTITYLTFSGSFALINNQDDVVVGDVFLNGSAYQKNVSVNEYPTVIIPVKTDAQEYTTLIENARNNPETSTDDEGNETSIANIYLLFNYVEGDTYKILQEKGKLSEKTLLTFDATTDDTLYLDGKNENGRASFFQTCGFQDSNGNGVADPSEVKAAFAQADYLTNLINAKALDYDVKCIKGLEEGTKVWVAPKVEPVMEYGSIKYNATLISITVAFVVISLLLVIFYRLGAMNIMSLTVLGTFLTFLFVTLMGLEYNTLAIVGYVLVALIGIISGIIYCSKLKDEAYRGRSLKKANAEASKKSLLPIVDIHIVGIIVGLLIFLLGGQAIHTFASILTLGSLVSLVLNTLGLKGMMWLATNTTALTGKYEVFGIDPSNVPNHMAEEKQRFYGAYAEKDFSKKKKSVSIATLCLFVLAVAGIAVSSSLNSGNLFKQGSSKVTGSEIYIVNTIDKIKDDTKTELDNDAVEEILNNIIVYKQGESVPATPTPDDTHTRLSSFVTISFNNIKAFTVNEEKFIDESARTYVTTYFKIPLKENVNGSKYFAKVVNETIVEDTTLDDVLDTYFTDYGTQYTSSNDISNSIAVKDIATVPAVATPQWEKTTLAVFIAVLVLTLYFMLRYRLSRGLAMLLYPLVSSAITLGFFVLLSVCGLALPANIIICMPIICLLTYTFMVLAANKERDILADDKVKDNTLEHRMETGKRAMAIAFTPILAVIAIAIYLLINFFGFAPATNSFAYLAGIIGVLISLGIVAVTYMPLSNLLFKWFSRVHIERKPRKNKKNIQVVKKSAEPEEAIFIGIND